MKEKIALPVSVVVPCFNRARHTHDLLQSFVDASFSCEQILVDDASQEDLQAVVNTFPQLAITYFRNPENIGPAASRNKGIELATTDWIAFTDNDCTVTTDWLMRLYEYASNSGQKTAGVGGHTIAKHNDLISQYYTYHKILDPWFYQGQYLYIVTCNAMFRRSALLEVGGFDTSIQQAGGEDPGLCFKLLDKGYQLQYYPDAVVVHEYDNSLLNLFKTFYRYGLGCSVQARKYFRGLEYRKEGGYAGLKQMENIQDWSMLEEN